MCNVFNCKYCNTVIDEDLCDYYVEKNRYSYRGKCKNATLKHYVCDACEAAKLEAERQSAEARAREEAETEARRAAKEQRERDARK